MRETREIDKNAVNLNPQLMLVFQKSFLLT